MINYISEYTERSSIKCIRRYVDWVYNASFCSDEICSRLKNKRDCKQSCKWLIGGGCVLKISYDTKMDEYKNILIMYIIVFVILAILLLVSIILIIYAHNQNIIPGYELLHMNIIWIIFLVHDNIYHHPPPSLHHYTITPLIVFEFKYLIIINI